MALIRMFTCSILPLLALALLAFAEEPSPRQPYNYPYDPATDIITAMHMARADTARLFTRLGSWELWSNDAMVDAQTRLNDPDVIEGWRAGRMDYTHFHDSWAAEWLLARNRYRIFPHDDATTADIEAIRAFIAPNVVTVEEGPTDGYAHVCPDGTVVFGCNAMTDSGLCDRSVVLHEMSHWFQFRLKKSYGMSTQDYWHHSMELAAMIVESAEKIRQGYTADNWDTIDRMQVPYATDSVYACYEFERPIYPHMGGRLAYQQILKYGPHFTGEMSKDLLILQDWIAAFEKPGSAAYSLMNPLVRGQYIEFARKDVERHTCSPLFSTSQSWLAVNGARSFYPVKVQQWSGQPPETAQVETLIRTKLWTDLPADVQQRCREFLDRCQAR